MCMRVHYLPDQCPCCSLQWGARISSYMHHVLIAVNSETSSPGQILLQQQNMEFQLLLEPNTEPPVFTLTCVTTGGPPTNVTWTRDDTVIDYQCNDTFRFSRTVTDLGSATYNNTLTVTGNFPGCYTISAQNTATIIATTATLQVEGEHPLVHKLINYIAPL